MVPEPHSLSNTPIASDGRRLIAVVFADMVGYSRLIGLDDAGLFRRLRELHTDLIDPALARHSGILVGTAGDSLLMTFDSIIAAVRFAVDVQRGIPEFDGDYPPDRRIRFRMGINVGDVIADGINLHGDGVNIAARLQALCPPGSICVSRVVRDHVGNRLGLGFKELGSVNLKNIARPTEAFLIELAPAAEAPILAAPPKRSNRSMALVGIALVLIAIAIVLGSTQLHMRSEVAGATQPANTELPILSIAVLPFLNLSDDPAQTYLADGISEDLTTDLSHLDKAFVIARESAFTYRGKSLDVRDVGRQLGVRYVLEGSVRKLGDAVRINAQLISADDGRHIWADRFDQPLRDLQAGQDSTVQRIGAALNVKFDSARQLPKMPAPDPAAYDLIWRAKAMLHERQSDSRDTIAAGYFEQALRVDPTSVAAKSGVATMLLKTSRSTKRAADLIANAELVAPNSPDVLAAKFRLLRRQQRYEPATATFRKLLDIDSSAAGIAAEFEYCSRCWGRPEDAIALLERTAQLNPLSPDRSVIYVTLARMLILVGRDAEAINWLESARHLNAQQPPSQRPPEDVLSDDTKLLLAAAYALTGQVDDAHAMLASAMSSALTMDFTVRGFLNTVPKYYDAPRRQQELRLADGLRQAGMRDHLDEQANYGIQSTAELQDRTNAPTPLTVPGATTITTEGMVKLLEQKPFVLTTAATNPTVPGAISFDLPNSGTLTDEWQTALGKLMEEVTKGDKQHPIVTFAYSINRWHSRNLALRLVALGYREVYWYRGGWEAWDAHDLPKAPLDLQIAPRR